MPPGPSRNGRRPDPTTGRVPLTPAGRAEVEATARALAARGVEVAEIRHSGLVRARETAEILGGVLTPARGIRATTGLAPEDAPDVAAGALERVAAPLMLVGHLPHLARLAAALVGGATLERSPLRPGDGRGAPARPGRLGAGAGRPAGRRSGALMPHLACVRCGATAPLGPAFEGCAACAGEPRPALEVVYDYAALAAAGTLKAWTSRTGGLWRFRELLPPPADASLLSLAEGATPLVRLQGSGDHRIWLKDETRNPDGILQRSPPCRVPDDGARARVPESRRLDDGESRHGARGLCRAGGDGPRSCSAIPGRRWSSDD